MTKKFIAEFFGTAILVSIGCGCAMVTGCEPFAGYLLTALAFGLAIVAAAYSIGEVSGCHINPAVSLAMLIDHRITAGEFLCYLVAQVLGATAGSAITWLILSLGSLTDQTGGFGSNGLSGVNGNAAAGLLVEIFLTFVFILTIMFVTANKERGHIAGIVIALTLVLVHLIGIQLTGTSVNPARSFGPALIALFAGNASPISQLWVFIVGPFVGGVLAAVIYKVLRPQSK